MIKWYGFDKNMKRKCTERKTKINKINFMSKVLVK